MRGVVVERQKGDAALEVGALLRRELGQPRLRVAQQLFWFVVCCLLLFLCGCEWGRILKGGGSGAAATLLFSV